MEKYFLELASNIESYFHISVKVIKRKRLHDFTYINYVKDFIEHRKITKDPFTLHTFLWNPYTMYIANNFFKNKANQINLYEDGSTIIQTEKPQGFKKKLKKLLYNISFEEFFSNINKVFVSNKKNYDKFSYNKILEEETLEDIIKTLDDITKMKIINLFLGNIDINILKDNRIKKSIIFTQPLSEDGFESEKNKIEIYKKMIDMKIIEDSLIFFKKHPRDETNYKFIQEKSNVIVLNSKFPSEIFLILKVEFKVSLGLCTSAVENIDAEIKCNTSPNYFVTKHQTKKYKKGFF